VSAAAPERAVLATINPPRAGEGVARMAMLMPDGREIVCGVALDYAAYLIARLAGLIGEHARRERQALQAAHAAEHEGSPQE